MQVSEVNFSVFISFPYALMNGGILYKTILYMHAEVVFFKCTVYAVLLSHVVWLHVYINKSTSKAMSVIPCICIHCIVR